LCKANPSYEKNVIDVEEKKKEEDINRKTNLFQILIVFMREDHQDRMNTNYAMVQHPERKIN
jgi:hypothetical protein